MRKYLSLLLLMTMLLSMAAACGNTETASVGETDAGQVQTETAEAETDYLETLGDKDFGGSEYVYIIPRNTTIPLLNPPEEQTTGEPMNDAQYNRDSKLMDLYNVNITYPETADVEESICNAVLAGDTICDVYVHCLADGLRAMGLVFTRGALQDLNELPYVEPTNAWYSQLVNEQLSYKGKLFFTSGDMAISSYIGPACVYMNLNLAENHAIEEEEIYSTVYDGSWTYDKLYGYYDGLDNDVNGDGKIEYTQDFYGMVNETNDLTAALLLASCGVKMSETVDNRLVVDLDNEKVHNAVEKMNRYFDVIVGNELNTELYDNVFKNSRALFAVHYIESSLYRLRDMEDDYVILPMPKYDLTQETYISYINPWTYSFIAVPLVLEDREKTGFITEAMAYESLQSIRPAVYDITLKGKAARNEDCLAMIDIVFNTTYLDINSIFNFGGSLSAARAGIFTDNGYAAEYAKIASKIDTAVEEFEENFN